MDEHPNDSRRKWRRLTLAALIGTLAAGTGAAWAHGGPGWHHGRHGWHADARDLSPEALKQRTEAMVKYFLAGANATEAQQTRIAEIVGAAMTDLRPYRENRREARKAAVELLAQPVVDRTALEQIRARELAAAESVSKRMTQAVADIAEVLTPEQRKQLAGRLDRMRDGRRG